jgi:signal transduction histidine kinase
LKVIFIFIFSLLFTLSFGQESINLLNKRSFDLWQDGKIDSAISIFKIIIKEQYKVRNLNGISIVNSYLGNLYLDKNIKDSSIFYYRKSLQLSYQLKNEQRIIESLCNISNAYQTFNVPDSVIYFSTECLKYVTSNERIDYLRKCYGNLAGAYEQINDSKNYLYYYNLYSTIDNQIKNKTLQQEIIQKNIFSRDLTIQKLKSNIMEDSLNLSIKLSRQQQLEIDVLYKDKLIKEKDIKLYNEKIAYENKTKSLLFIIIVIIFIFLIITIKGYFNKIKMNNELKKINATKDKFLSIISHDLKSPIRSLNSLTEMIFKKFDNMKEEKKKEILQIVSKESKKLYELLENLLNWSRSQRGTIEFKPQEILVNDIINDNISLLEGVAKEKNIDLKSNLDKNIILNIDKNMISTVFRNLISNALKFTNENGKVHINYNEQKNYIILSVDDDGVGMSEESIKKLFKIESSFSTKGTKNESGTGLGLILCKDFITSHKGEIFVESKINEGTSFKIKIYK